MSYSLIVISVSKKKKDFKNLVLERGLITSFAIDTEFTSRNSSSVKRVEQYFFVLGGE